MNQIILKIKRISIFLIPIWLLIYPVNAKHFGPFKSSFGPIIVEKMSGPFHHPWALAFLPIKNTYLVTERIGSLRLVRNGRISKPISGVPNVWASGQGGLLDVVVDQNFNHNNRIFFCYSEKVGKEKGRTTLATGLLMLGDDAPSIQNMRILFRQYPATRGTNHFGSRIVLTDDGKLFLTLGDRGNRHLVQDLSNHFGKVIRINKDGTVPKDNPFLGQNNALPEIWSYGHRNPQGAVKKNNKNLFYTVSHGAAGGDEINLLQPGKNFGWPDVSYGTHYDGRPFPHATRSDVVPPLLFWDPSIAPSGAAFYEGIKFKSWDGNLFVGALRGQAISRILVKDGTAKEVERMLSGKFGRIRDVRIGPDDTIWFSTDYENGGIYRIKPYM